MGELKWICPKCASEETIVLQPVEKPNGSIEFVYDGKILGNSRLPRKDDIVLYCTVCGYKRMIKNNEYIDTCAQTMKQKISSGTSTSGIAIGVAIGVIVGSIILYMIITEMFF